MSKEKLMRERLKQSFKSKFQTIEGLSHIDEMKNFDSFFDMALEAAIKAITESKFDFNNDLLKLRINNIPVAELLYKYVLDDLNNPKLATYISLNHQELKEYLIKAEGYEKIAELDKIVYE